MTAATRARYDKLGRRLPETGHGCGCGLCEATNAARYERRSEPGRPHEVWTPLQRKLARMIML